MRLNPSYQGTKSAELSSVAAVLRRRGHTSKSCGGGEEFMHQHDSATPECAASAANNGQYACTETYMATSQEQHSSNWNWTSVRANDPATSDKTSCECYEIKRLDRTSIDVSLVIIRPRVQQFSKNQAFCNSAFGGEQLLEGAIKAANGRPVS